jgi:hypothetical protein
MLVIAWHHHDCTPPPHRHKQAFEFQYMTAGLTAYLDLTTSQQATNRPRTRPRPPSRFTSYLRCDAGSPKPKNRAKQNSSNRVRGRVRVRFLYLLAASQRDNENKNPVGISITGYAFSRATPRKSGACGAADFFQGAGKPPNIDNELRAKACKYSLDTCVPEGRSENRRASGGGRTPVPYDMQSARPGGPG